MEGGGGGGGCNEKVETKRVVFAYKILDRQKEGSLEGDAEARERTGHGGVRQEDDPRADARGG